jgi:hypothetical protein
MRGSLNGAASCVGIRRCMILRQKFITSGTVVSVRTLLLFLYARSIIEEKRESTGWVVEAFYEFTGLARRHY